MKSQETPTPPNVAVYWDFENIHASLHEHEIGPYKGDSRYKVQPELVDIGAIMDYASTVGSICVNRAYCNWSYFHRYQDALSGHGISLVQMFPRGQHGKNGADVQMCVDMVEDLLRLQLDVYIIVSGDSDYIGAAQKVRQYGKRVIGIGVRNYTNRYFQRVCDEFKFYDSLEQQELEGAIAMDDSGKMSTITAKKLLATAVNRLAIQCGDASVMKARVKPMMLRLEPAFDERDLGYANFSAFLADCTDIIEERVGEADHMISLRSEGSPATVQPPAVTDKALAELSKLLVAAMTFLLRTRSSVRLPALKSMMIQLQPEFDEKKLGFRTFTAFLQRFPEQVAIHGEKEFRHVVLLAAPDDFGFTAPPSPAAHPSSATIPAELLNAAIQFHAHELLTQPAVSWVDYYDRLRAKLTADGRTADESQLKSIKAVFWRAKVFRMLPNQGGISVQDEMGGEEGMRSAIELAQGSTEQPGLHR